MVPYKVYAEKVTTEASMEDQPLAEKVGAETSLTNVAAAELAIGEGNGTKDGLGSRAWVAAEESMNGSAHNSLGGVIEETISSNCHNEPREGGCFRVNSNENINEEFRFSLGRNTAELSNRSGPKSSLSARPNTSYIQNIGQVGLGMLGLDVGTEEEFRRGKVTENCQTKMRKTDKGVSDQNVQARVIRKRLQIRLF